MHPFNEIDPETASESETRAVMKKYREHKPRKNISATRKRGTPSLPKLRCLGDWTPKSDQNLAHSEELE
jgi:hypothetical protein